MTVKYDGDNPKVYKVLDRIDEFGKSRLILECPFCKSDFTAYIWSLSGGGKKCPDCGAIHYSCGSAHRVIK